MKSRCLLLFNIAVVFCWVEVGAQRSGPSGYWQQHINYNIEVDMNVETSQYEGKQRVVYTNNSPISTITSSLKITTFLTALLSTIFFPSPGTVMVSKALKMSFFVNFKA